MPRLEPMDARAPAVVRSRAGVPTAGGEYARLHAEIARTVAVGFMPRGRPTPPVATGPSLAATSASRPAADPGKASGPTPASTARRAAPSLADSPQTRFLAQILPHAQRVAGRLGVAPELVAAHAALESGWGTRAVPGHDGRPSHNLFGIKAGEAWRGASAAAWTTEFEGGTPLRARDDFRTYPGFSAAFDDYASLLLQNSRYSGLVNAGNDARRFAGALQAGGYATDPRYAGKLARLAEQVAKHRATMVRTATQRASDNGRRAWPGSPIKGASVP